MNQAGRSGSVWRRTRLAVLRDSHGHCALCHRTRCPKHGRLECDGHPGPGQVHHIVPPDVAPNLACDRRNLLAAHGCCNRARNRLALLDAELALAGLPRVVDIGAPQGGTPWSLDGVEARTGPPTAAGWRPGLASDPPGTVGTARPPAGPYNGVHGRLVPRGG